MVYFINYVLLNSCSKSTYALW